VGRILSISRIHNARPVMLFAGTLACFLLLGSCGRDRDSRTVDADSKIQKAETCTAFLSDRGLKDFLSLADRNAAGKEVTLDDANELAESTVYISWRQSYVPEQLSVEIIGRSMLIAMAGREALTARQRAAHEPVPLTLNLQEILKHRNHITAFLDDFIREDRVCEVYDLLAQYLPASDMPDTLRIEFLAGLPEMRFSEGAFLIDAGLAWAIGHGQMVKALTSMLYRMITSYERPSLREVRGVDLLLYTLRQVHHEAIPAYIDAIDKKSFDYRYTRLSGASVSEFELLQKAHIALRSLQEHLAAVRAKQTPSHDDWLVFHRFLIEDNNAHQTGWFMARTIADQLGQDRLQQVARSVADFFAAYQEACTHMPQRPDIPRMTEEWFIVNPPRLSQENAAWLIGELRRLFP
jgi:hypothetical protein